MLIDEGLSKIPALPSQHLNRKILPGKSMFNDEFTTKRMNEIKNFLNQYFQTLKLFQQKIFSRLQSQIHAKKVIHNKKRY